jgi:serine/threonine protein kinase
VGFDYIPNGILTADGPQAIVVMDWVNAVPLKRYIANHIKESHVIRNLANSFKTMVEELHVLHWAHGDLQHGNILVRENGGLVLVDYDSMYVPTLSGFSDDIKGIAGYQHPARWKNNTLNETVDYFSELIIYTSLVALSKYPDLWTSLQLSDTETMLFSEDDLSSKGKSAIFKSLEQDSELIILANRIKEFLAEERITRLLPLEQAIVDPIAAQVEDVSKLWKNPTKKPEPDYNSMADAVSKLW